MNLSLQLHATTATTLLLGLLPTRELLVGLFNSQDRTHEAGKPWEIIWW